MGTSKSTKSRVSFALACGVTAVGVFTTGGCAKHDSKAWAEALDASVDEESTETDEDTTSSGLTTQPQSVAPEPNTSENTDLTSQVSESQTSSDDDSTTPSESDAGVNNTDETEPESTSSSAPTSQTGASVTPDAGSPTTEPDDVPNGDSCAGHDYLLCESFEDAEEGEIPDGWERRGDEVYVSSEAAFGGERSLKLGATDSSERRIARDATILGSTHWGRIRYRVEVPVPDAFVHATIVALTGDGPINGPSEYRFVDMVKQAADTPDVGSRHNWLFNVQVTGEGERTRETGYDWEYDGEWHCVEYYVDSVQQGYKFYFDGNEEMSFEEGSGNHDFTDLPDEFEQIRVGWVNYQAAPPGFVAYLDDIAFDDTRIGCD